MTPMWLHILFVVIAQLLLVTKCDAAFTKAACAALNATSVSEANTLTANVADLLVGEGKPFVQAVDGVLVTIMNGTSGGDDGGASNPNGSYMVIYLLTDEGSPFLPKGACDFPSCTNGTGTFECHDRCASTPNGRVTDGILLGPADALVVTLCTPTEMKYFGYDTYIGTRTTHDPEPFYPGQNFGDPINVMNIAVAPDASSEFLQPVAFVSTADGATAQVVSDAYGNAGFDTSSVNVRAVDSDVVRMWDRTQDNEPDFLFSLLRMSVPDEERIDQFKQYQKASWPVKLYLAADDAQAKEPLHPRLAPRHSSDVIDEQVIYTELMNGLEDGIKEHWQDMSKICRQTLNTTTYGTYDDWTHVLQAKNNDTFVVPTRDATYGIPGVAVDGEGNTCGIAVSSKHIGVVFGLLHTETLQLLYSQISLAVFQVVKKNIVDTLSFETDARLKGSARRYLSNEVLDAATKSGIDVDMLYAVDVKGPGVCGDAEIAAGTCIEWGEYSLAMVSPIAVLGERLYCSKATTVGPDASQTIASRMLSFGP